MAKLKQVIPFNSPFISGQELLNFKKVLKNKKFSGRGSFTKKCEDTLTKKFDRYSLLTTSCTHALEIIAFLLNIKKGDEIIVPSFTFVSTANAFAIRGAKIVFADSKIDSPCIDSTSIKKKNY
jgi:dTDP-4-amino-4,6-dideoxygalactose transaminase